jgi:hypothetical protein
MFRRNKILFCSLLLTILLIGSADAQPIEADVVNGNTYTCYFISPLDVVSTNITFEEKGGMVFSSFPGSGLYFTLTSLFTGSYWSLNTTIGNKSGDIIFLISGSSSDFFIAGTGIMIIEYRDIYFMVFFGTKLIEEQF